MQSIESNVLTASLFKLERLAETWTQDWLNTNERPRKVISGITFLNAIKHRLELSWMCHLQHKLPTMTCTKRYTTLEQQPLSEPISTAACPLLTTHNANERHQQPIDRSDKTATNTTFRFRWPITFRKNWSIQTTARGNSTILTLKMTTTYVVVPSVTNTSLSETTLTRTITRQTSILMLFNSQFDWPTYY